ncbi:hypothetical protein BH09CHL1_BH09CHL1_11710 [soil metagenome]
MQELLPLYALGALDQDEVGAIAAHLPLCPSCSADLVRFDSITGALAAPLAPLAPDASVRAGLFDRIAVTPQEFITPIIPISQEPPANVVSINRARSSTWRTWLVSAAAVLLVLGGGAGYWMNSLANDRDDAQHTAAMLTEFMSPETVAYNLPAMSGSTWGTIQGVGKFMKSPNGDMMVMVANCPPTTEDRVYKVWVAVGDDRQVVGDVTITADGTGWMPLTFPGDMQNPDILGISMLIGGDELTDLFVGPMTG